MQVAGSWPVAVRVMLLAVSIIAGCGDSQAQQRRRQQEALPPPPAPAPLPSISEATGRCSFAFHDALSRIGDGSGKELSRFEDHARVVEPGLPGKWQFWIKGAKGAKAPTTEQVCAEMVVRAGRERCIKWETRKLEAAVAGQQPTADELAVMRSLDGFVSDRGAMLEFGPNGRQYAILQRVAAEISGYSQQPRHPALCTGVPQMMDFQIRNLAGLEKRFSDVAAQGAKAMQLTRARVAAARDARVAEHKAVIAANAAATAAAAAATPAEGEAAKPVVLKAVPPAPLQSAIPSTARPAEWVSLVLEGLLTPEQQAALAAQPGIFGKLSRAREFMRAEAMPQASAGVRASAGAALRSIETLAYSDLQQARMKQFQAMFIGTIDDIRKAHRANCTCGED